VGVAEGQIKIILERVDSFKTEAAACRKQVEDRLAEVAARPDNQHEDRLAALASAVTKNQDARVRLLENVYGELTSVYKCKVASATIGRM